jgi:spermidine synthase
MALIPLLFFCSGASALIYEVIWSRYLALIFGSTIQAQTVVLAVFMGGLALGNRIFGTRASKFSSPLAAYGYLEIAIGLYAFFFPNLYNAVDFIFVKLGTGLLVHSTMLLLLKGILSVVLLLGPTILMGGTLPVLATWLDRRHADAGVFSARFYSINTLGAVAGAGLSGFLLIQALGLVSGLQVTAFANVLVGVVASLLGRKEIEQRGTASESSRAVLESSSSEPESASKLFYWIVGVVGAVSMGMEVLAARFLSLMFGASAHAFSTVLVAFILGIGAGSAIIASKRFERVRTPRTIVVLLLSAALFLLVAVICIEKWAVWYSQARYGIALNAIGYLYHRLLLVAISIVFLGIPAGLLGAILPLCMQCTARRGSVGQSVGRLLTANTLGAVIGVLVAGFFLMPLVGLRGAFVGLGAVLCCLACVLAAGQKRPALAGFCGITMAVFVLVGIFFGEGWRSVVSLGVFRVRMPITEAGWRAQTALQKIIFYEDAPDSTVSVEMTKNATNNLSLRVNGKPDASTMQDMSTQLLMAHLPMLAKPDAKEAFVLGFGSGVSGGTLLSHPIERLTVAENCGAVLRAGKLFERWNRGVLTNSRARFFNDDGRTVLKLDPTKYDIIISEPSNPWVAGVGNVFSREFYELAQSRLKEDGIMAQWFHIYEMEDAVCLLVIRTFASMFPAMEIWSTLQGDIVMLGSRRAWPSTAAHFQTVYDRAEPRKDLEMLGHPTAESIFLRQFASQRTAFAIAGPGPTQSDLFPILEFEAPRAFYLAARAQSLQDFDELTWCSMLASPEKRAALRKVPEDVLRATFQRYGTSDSELSLYFSWLRTEMAGAGKNPVYPASLVPVIVRSAPSYDPTEGGMLKTDSRQAKMNTAIVSLFTEVNWKEGVEAIRHGLRTWNDEKEPLKQSAGFWASMAAQSLMQHHDFEGATEMINLGKKLDPVHEHYGYLERILEREWNARQ